MVASSITPTAINILKRKNDRCLIMTNEQLGHIFLSKQSLGKDVLRRQVRGGWIEQPNYSFVLDISSNNIVRYNPPSDVKEIYRRDEDTVLGWAICSTSNSNTITLVKDGMLIGNGVGQQDRVEAAELALKRAKDAGHSVEGAVALSDSFFPYPDAPELLIKSGVCRIFATSGSVNDDTVIGLFKDSRCELLHIPDKLGRGFSNH